MPPFKHHIFVCENQRDPSDPRGCCTRGFRVDEFETIGHLIADVLEGLADNVGDMSGLEARVKHEVVAMTREFPIYQSQ